MSSGLSVYLPPEVLVTPNGMVGRDRRPDLTTLLRCIYAFGNTPMIFNGILPGSVEDLTPDVRERFLHHAKLYKTFIRPLLSTCRVYHHAPVNATGGVESGGWFVMEFMAPDGRKGWVTLIRYGEDAPAAYLLKPRGVVAEFRYDVILDNTGRKSIASGARLIEDGLSIEIQADPTSELVLLEAP
jgi:hypothetical protein